MPHPPESVHDPQDGESRRDDDEALVLRGRPLRRDVLVRAPLEHSLVDAVDAEGVGVGHAAHLVVLAVDVVHPRNLEVVDNTFESTGYTVARMVMEKVFLKVSTLFRRFLGCYCSCHAAPLVSGTMSTKSIPRPYVSPCMFELIESLPDSAAR